MYMLQMLYVRASEQKRFLDIRRFINTNYYYNYYYKVVAEETLNFGGIWRYSYATHLGKGGVRFGVDI